MKKQILATLVLVSVLATTTAAGKKDTDYSTSKAITLKQGFTKLVVDGNVDVVLYEDNSGSAIRTFGNSNDVAATSIKEENGVLTIHNKNSKGEKVLVYVPVRQLEVIEASGNSKVSSASMLASAQLTLIVKGECKFNIQSAGNIDVLEQGQGEEVTVEKKNIAIKSSQS